MTLKFYRIMVLMKVLVGYSILVFMMLEGCPILLMMVLVGKAILVMTMLVCSSILVLARSEFYFISVIISREVDPVVPRRVHGYKQSEEKSCSKHSSDQLRPMW